MQQSNNIPVDQCIHFESSGSVYCYIATLLHYLISFLTGIQR